jgi:hypothetical protein
VNSPRWLRTMRQEIVEMRHLCPCLSEPQNPDLRGLSGFCRADGELCSCEGAKSPGAVEDVEGDPEMPCTWRPVPCEWAGHYLERRFAKRLERLAFRVESVRDKRHRRYKSRAA